jgi:hypothetical protein
MRGFLFPSTWIDRKHHEIPTSEVRISWCSGTTSLQTGQGYAGYTDLGRIYAPALSRMTWLA